MHLKHIWDCLHLFPKKHGSISNKPIDASIAINSFMPKNFHFIWNHSRKRICADGGANHVYDYIHASANSHLDLRLPSDIVGDLDSLRNDAKVYFESLGTIITKMNDQDSTDLEKSYQYISQNEDIHEVVILGGGGSLSHEIANFSAAMKYQHYRSIFVACNNISFILNPGVHEIYALGGEKCSILPLFKPCSSLKTRGLKWDLDEKEMKYGELISKSNVIEGTSVIIENSDPLLWLFDLD